MCLINQQRYLSIARSLLARLPRQCGGVLPIARLRMQCGGMRLDASCYFWPWAQKLNDLQYKYAVLTRESGDLDELKLKYSVLVRQNKEMVTVFAEKMVIDWRRTRIKMRRGCNPTL